MNASMLLADLTRRGIKLSAAGERLSVDTPKGVITDDLRAMLMEHRESLLQLLTIEDTEVEWRIAVMRQQVRRGPIFPFLVARRDFVDAPGCCLSCGDPCGAGRRYRCGPCVRAAEIVVNEAWEGRHRQRAGAPGEQHDDQ
jgi:hypothetical protein